MKNELYERIDTQKEELTRLTDIINQMKEKSRLTQTEVANLNRRNALLEKENSQIQRKLDEVIAVNKEQK